MVKVGKVGVFLVNFGMLDVMDYWLMCWYLWEFLFDKCVIEWLWVIWYLIFYGIVLMIWLGKLGKVYDEIWNYEKNELLLCIIMCS